MGIRVDRVAVPGGYVRVTSMDGPSGTTFVLVPGLGIAASYFERLAPRLAGAGRVIAVDLPGFSGVPRVGRTYTTADAADHLLAALAAAGAAAPVLIGHSLGSQIVVEAARNADLETLVLLSPVLASDSRRPLVAAWRFLTSSLHEPFGIVTAAVASYLTTGMGGFLRTLPAMLDYRIERRLGEVDAPVTLVVGSRDALQTRAWIDRLVVEAREARVRVIRGAAHSVMHRSADQVARIILGADGGAEVPALVSPVSPAQRLTPRLALRVVAVRIREMRAMRRQDDAVLEQTKTWKIEDARRRGLL